MPKSQAGSDPALNDERSAMHRPVMRSTQRDELVRVVLAALGARHQMVRVDVNRVTTPRHDAAVVVAPQHQASDGWRDGLTGTGQSRAHVVGLNSRVDVRRDCRRARVGVCWDCRRAQGAGRSVNATDVLCVARCHLDYLRPYVDQLAISVQGSALAALAHR